MKESVQIAVTLVKSRYPEKADLFEKNDLHVHVPAGAVPKDGPSAGITLTTAIASLVTGKSGFSRIRHDGRSFFKRQSDADRRTSGEADGGSESRHIQGADPGRRMSMTWMRLLMK